MALNIPFSGEEQFGKCLDLHQLYFMLTNSNFGHRSMYCDYVAGFPGLKGISSTYKMTPDYQDYIVAVLNYLISFVERAEPLMFLDTLFKNLESEFEERWVPDAPGQKRPRPTSDVIEMLDEHDSVESLMELGPDKLKQTLACLGLKCGGTVRQRAERLFLIKTTPLDEIHPKVFIKKGRVDKETALTEAKIYAVLDLLKDKLSYTVEHAYIKTGLPRRPRVESVDFSDCVACRHMLHHHLL